MILLMYTMKRRPSNEAKKTTGKYVFPSVLRHSRLCHKISGKNTYYQTQYEKRLYDQISKRSNFLSDQMEKGEKNFGCPSVSKKSIWHTEYLYLLLCGFYRTTLRQVHHYSQRCGNDFRHFSRRIESKCAPNSRISDSGTRCRQKKYSRN